jgi:chemotaxis response regulator CheB
MSAVPEQRVVIFGREGLAREQLVAALSDFGVQPIWVGKPVQSDPEKLSEMNPSQIIISLEPLIESELLPYSDFLSQSDINVLYDDAESTRHLSGWDLNRWARHMASKLLNQDYMPPAPGAEQKTEQEVPDIETDDTSAIDFSVQSSNTASKIVEPEEFEYQSFDWQSSENYNALDINPAELSAALDKLNQNLTDSSDLAAIREMNYEQLIPLTESELLEFQSQPAIVQSSSENEDDLSLKSDVESDLGFADLDFDSIEVQNIDTGQQSVYMDEDALKLAEMNLDAQLASSDIKSFLDTKLELQTAETISLEVVSAIAAKPSIREFDLSKFSLVDDQENNDTLLPADSSQPLNEQVKLTELNPVSERSLFLVISGLGGPGVARSIVGKINSNFPGIFVLAQTIEPVQLPKLLMQLQKVASIPVIIPVAEEYLKNGNMYLLPEKHTIQRTALGYQCVCYGSLSGFIAQVDQNVEIMVLSGADAALAQSLIQVSAVMTNIHVQSPDDCFDATLPQLLVNMGVPVIRQDILDTWFN